CGQIYSHTTNPPVATGDGIAEAFNAGAVLEDMEFIQFHPTTLYLGDKKPISIFLISESVRGEGAVLRNIKGERFMLKYHPDAELAPRDIVARSITLEIKKTKSECVFLDLTSVDKDIQDRFPLIYQRCLESNIDITKDLIPVIPAAHYFMGGIKTNSCGSTSVQHLYAIGETAALAVHGANRLASNSLLDGLVFGYRASQDALKIQENPNYLPKNFIETWSEKIKDITPEQKLKALIIKQKIRKLMWRNVGIIRNAKGLQKTLNDLKKFDLILKISTLEEEFLEVQNMLIIAKLVTLFALKRQESRGAHYRSDYPEPNNFKWQIHQSTLDI
ncbi:MAG: FAD-binding protein, partial [Candidatus Margulisiibacteriota bacterium]